MTQFPRPPKPEATFDSTAAPLALETFRRNPLHALWHHKWIVAVTVLLVVTCAVIYLVRAQRVYQAAARLTVERNGPRIVNNDPSESVGQTQNFLNTQCEVLKSRKIFQALAEDPEIVAMRTFQGNSDQIVGYLKGHVAAAPAQRNDVITVAVGSPYPEDAARLANAIVDAYKADLEKQKKSSVRQVIDFYEREKEKIRERLEKSRAQKLQFQTEYAELALGSQQISPLSDRVARLSTAHTQLQLEELSAGAALNATRAIANDPAKIRQLLDSRQFRGENAELRQQMRQLQQRFAAVGSTYLSNFPDVGVVQSAIKQLKTELDAEDKKTFDAYVSELDSKVLTIRTNRSQVEALLNEAKAKEQSLYKQAARFNILQSEVESLAKYDNDLAMRIQELSPLSDEAMVNVNIVENARTQDAAQVQPEVATTMYLALFGGAFFGSLLAMARDFLDQRLRSAEEIKQVTGLPLLGMVPNIRGGATPAERALTLHNEPMSDVAESYRTIRTAVYFGSPGGTARTVLITSPSPGEGKSTLASNLAIAMAQAGNRIMLLDADFRKPSQHKIYGIDRGVGLSNVLAGHKTLEETIRPTMVSGLDVLACGPVPANPSEILNSQMFADVLEELTERYDHVLLDSPPVMPVTDARILAASCDATVLAIRAEKTARRAAVFARDVLRSVGARLIGVVVNDVPRRKGLYGYYYTDSQLYHYGYGTPVRAREKGAATANASGETASAEGNVPSANAPRKKAVKA